MSFDQQKATDRARADLSQRLGIDASEVTTKSVGEADFPDAALGAPIEDEMSAQMITSGARILLAARGAVYEYRANQSQLRLYDFNGDNYLL